MAHDSPHSGDPPGTSLADLASPGAMTATLSSEVLIRRIVRKRLRVIQGSLIEAATGETVGAGRVLLAAQSPRGPIPLLVEGNDNASWGGEDAEFPWGQAVATPRLLDLILPDAAIGQRRGPEDDSARATVEFKVKLAMLWILLEAAELLVHYKPAFTRTDLLTFVATAWPRTRGRADGPQFDDALILAAHDALIRERPGWGSRAACEELANRLGPVSVDTVRRALRRARASDARTKRTKRPARKTRHPRTK